ncbi:hypothetical protein DC498_12255 [Terrimonas sp.]|uniref:hypothetical protein n=1 Tax=Terrimonas sp. TaxID=1914338 RepID=UPI000D520362|nr:hypothetical protein [Terrimonas sp.]PVD51821.1 hypothetical protein DC498_12255 [Terrimonas sp.]
MNRITLILTIALYSKCFGQDHVKFVIKESINNDGIPKLDRNTFKVDNNKFFEDSFYLVSKTCSGEWGGTIKFKDKHTGIEYSAASTCPVVVNKLNDKYYITNTLAHLSGFSEILEVSDPKALTVFEFPKPRKKKGKTIIRYVGDDESKSTKGTKQLLDSIGILTIASFPFQGQLYHIVVDYEKTYLTKLTNGKYITIDTISNQRLWTYDPEVFTTTDKHYIIFFDNSNTKGYYDIYENNITIVRQK